MQRRWIIVAFGVSLLAWPLAACGDGDDAGGEGTIEISAFDDLRFEPSSVTVQAGEPVTFVVTNEGETVHEFVLGPEHVQMAHEEASEMGMEHGGMDVEGQLAALEIEPGQTEEVTVTFDESGEMPFGCHEPGHYAGGMVGTVTVE
ncbi:MAG TPA: plastocyanin/azurin family copper-binding protein [Actinomycetota bacterium]